MYKYLIIATLLLSHLNIMAQDNEMRKIEGGVYVPLYGSQEEVQVEVKSFYMDTTPVTHQQYAKFVQEYPQWSKANVKALFADESYLIRWNKDGRVPEHLKNSPVTNISWYAAKEYCECQDKRLPTTDEWELAAMASANSVDAREDSLFNQKIIAAYEKPKTYLNEVGERQANYYGVYDLHGLVWEWVYDFNSIIMTAGSRSNDKSNSNLFCAGGAISANDLMNYAAFMRYAIRASMKARNSMTNMGFRCVKDAENEAEVNL